LPPWAIGAILGSVEIDHQAQGQRDMEQLETIDPGPEPGAPGAERIPYLSIAFHPDTRRIGQRLSLPSLVKPEGSMNLSRTGPAFCDFWGRQTGPLASPNLSRKALVFRSHPGGDISIHAQPGGSELALDEQIVRGQVRLSAARIERGVRLCMARRVVLLFHMRRQTEACTEDLGLVGHNEHMERLRRQVQTVAGQEAPVLLLGESGTGKELVARAIHGAMDASRRPFVAVNLAAIPASMAASELFGHKAGAFTGATCAQDGYFARAEGGTLFLDEVGAAEEQIQSALLRAIESGEIHPLGSSKPRRVRVRIVAATDAELEREVERGRFRAPLFHRLAGHLLRLPPLRQRRDDIGPLLLHFLKAELKKVGAERRLSEPPHGKTPWLPAGLVAELLCYNWPGNVRELKNRVRQMVSGFHNRDHVDPSIVPPTVPNADGALDRSLRSQKERLSEKTLAETLRQCAWSVSTTATHLGVSRNTLYALIAQCPSIRLARDLSQEEISIVRQECGGNLKAAAAELEVSHRALILHMKKVKNDQTHDP